MIDDAERRARLAHRHLLAHGAGAETVADAAHSVVALHSSDPITVYLAAARRLSTPSIAAIDAALYDTRSVIRHHAMRRTLWVVTPELAPVLHASATAGLVGPDRRRTAQWLVASEVAADMPSAERWIDDGIAELHAELHGRREATARELGAALPHLTAALGVAVDKSYGGTVAAHTRLLTLMGFMGLVLRGRPIGTWISGQYRWATTSTWLGADLPELPAAEAQRDLADAYLRAFGPATTVDVQWWTGWTKGATTRALASASAEAVELEDGSPAWVAAGDAGSVEPADPWAALLPSLDPTTMGWKGRTWFLPEALMPDLFDSNGNAGPTIWVDGRVVGGWGQRRDGTIATRLLTPITQRQQRAVAHEVDRVHALLDDVRFRVRFPSPLSRELAGT